MENKNPITIRATISAPIERVWEYYNSPEHITKWAFADDTWEAPSAENDLRDGGKFKTRMAAKDGSAAFDFEGIYSNVKEFSIIEYDMSDGRHVKTEFIQSGDNVDVVTTFDPEQENTEELQRNGWQAILNNFKKHVENS